MANTIIGSYTGVLMPGATLIYESDGTITLSKAPLNPAKPPVFLRITRYDNCLLDVIDRWCR